MQIRGEYWIENGNVQFADGDVGDYNHEVHAIEHVFYKFQDEIESLLEENEIEYDDLNSFDGIDIETISEKLQELCDFLEEEKGYNKQQIKDYLKQEIGCEDEALDILFGGGDGRAYCMIYEGWIAVRENNVELYEWNEEKRKDLSIGLNEILEDEGFNDYEEEDEEIEFHIYDLKTKRSFFITLEEIENPSNTLKSNQPQVNTKYHKSFGYRGDEDLLQNKSYPNKWNQAAKQQKVIGPGQELWRGTSENYNPISFKKWLNEK